MKLLNVETLVKTWSFDRGSWLEDPEKPIARLMDWDIDIVPTCNTWNCNSYSFRNSHSFNLIDRPKLHVVPLWDFLHCGSVWWRRESPELTKFKEMVAQVEPELDCLKLSSPISACVQALLKDFKDSKSLIEYLLNGAAFRNSLWQAVRNVINPIWYNWVQSVIHKESASDDAPVPIIPKRDNSVTVKKPESVRLIAKHAVQRHNYQLLI